MVSIADVTGILCPWLGTRFITGMPELPGAAAAILNGPADDESSLNAIRQSMDTLLFYSVRDKTLGRMHVLLDNGSSVRVRMSDFPVLADELMYLMFRDMPCDARHFLMLKEYSIRNDSMSALRALYGHYNPFQSAEELSAIRRIIRECHPAFRWRGWLS